MHGAHWCHTHQMQFSVKPILKDATYTFAAGIVYVLSLIDEPSVFVHVFYVRVRAW